MNLNKRQPHGICPYPIMQAYVCAWVHAAAPVVSDSATLDFSLPGSTVHGILQARIPGGLPFPSPGDFPPCRDRTLVSYTAGRFFTILCVIHPKSRIYPSSLSFSLILSGFSLLFHVLITVQGIVKFI